MTTDLEARIRERIQREGPLTFAAFMEMALYEPGLGYYTSGADRVGPQGDFYTSPAAHPAFAALLGLQVEQLWRLLGAPGAFPVLEVGAGKGLLRDDLHAFLEAFAPACARALRYSALDAGTPGAAWPASAFAGAIISNELFDSLPFHRLVREGDQLREVYVTLLGEGLAEVRAEPSEPALARYLEAEGITLEEGQETEVCLKAGPLLERLAGLLERGLIITVDYGELAPARHSRRRRHGTALCYYRHGTNEDFLRRLGRQDITAHVDFTALVGAGEAAGLENLGFPSQAELLRNLGWEAFAALLPRRGLPATQVQANLFGLRELVKPEGMGRFRALIQGRGLAAGELDGLRYDPQRVARLVALGERLPIPLLREAHTPLLAGRYPHTEVDWSDQLGRWLEEGTSPPPGQASGP
ncbi:MAG: SAM-dependent methyltransferase [Chloroflexi bacterium]|nr:SAM-dependent methyltransferase [Chloroflexota bacterium]